MPAGDDWPALPPKALVYVREGRRLLDGTVSLARFRQLVLADFRSLVPVGPDESD